MRKPLSVLGAALLAASMVVTPANAQAGGGQTPNQAPGQSGSDSSQQGQQQGQGPTQPGGQAAGSGAAAPSGQTTGGTQTAGGSMASGPMQAGGSCGPAVGMYGEDNVAASDFPGGGTRVPALFYQINYSGLPAPTTVGILRYVQGDLGATPAVSTFVPQTANGSFEGALRANISPEAQGGGNTSSRSGGSSNRNKQYRFGKGGLSNTPSNSYNHSARRMAPAQSGYQGGGAIPATEYVFYIYTGEIRDMPETVKDGPAGPRFFADPKGFLGEFSCAVVEDE